MDASIGTITEMDFDEAVAATRAALTERGFGILTEIDLTATLKEKVGADIERVLILGACNPQFAEKAFSVSKDVTLLMPCNVVIREVADGVVVEAFNPDLFAQIVSGGLVEITDPMAATFREMMSSLTR